MEEKSKKSSKKDLKREAKKCWGGSCNKTGWIDMYGWQYCIKHWRSDYKWGCEVGFKNAIKNSKFQLLKLLRNMFK